ncbi:Zinc/iron permease [Limtongia smithiae]|uniref:Zinc/iron permease n=1 Tax=Limtongia smithiae TaxID=1125753 RepID=UPI0034CE4B43
MADDLSSLVLNEFTRRDDCSTSNDYDGRLGVRISAIFVIMFSSMFGALFPIFTKHMKLRVHDMFYFVAKFFGSGVIVATAFIHLLDPAIEELSDECLTGTWQLYPWAIAIAMFAIFVLFFIEIATYRFANLDFLAENGQGMHMHDDNGPGTAKHFSHADSHVDADQGPEPRDAIRLQDKEDVGAIDLEEQENAVVSESLSAQLAAVVILEFGVVFHSIFIGLSLAVAGSEFNTLYVVLVFHQGFEGLGLGSRLAATPWRKDKRWVPFVMGIVYGLTTPIAIAIGLGVRYSYNDSTRRALIANGIFDSLSAGILLYTGLVELMAHEFLFSNDMKKAPFSHVLLAFGTMCLGAGLMALLGRWA